MGATHPKHGGANVRVPPPLVFPTFILIGVGLNWLVPLPLLHALSSGLRIALGAGLAIAGLAFGGWAFGLFKRTGQDPAPWMPSPTLVAEGAYRFSRNPMYVGMTAIQIGLGLALANPWMIGLSAVSLLVVHFTAVLPEEAYLTEKFGDSYTRYRASVRRYL
jgi:protein-S-isoprenylcysteine O-methyltransferase Ste14